MANKGTAAIAAAIIGFCMISVLFDILSIQPFSTEQQSPRLRRALQEGSSDGSQLDDQPLQGSSDGPQVDDQPLGGSSDGHQLDDEPGIYPWARSHIRPLDAVPDPGKETVVFWHIPKSGGITIKSMYECLGETIANQAGVDPRYGHESDEEIIAFRPWPGVSRASYVNVDTTNKPGIDRGRRLGLVPSGLVDLIITSDPTYAIQNLFDESHKGRVLALFRHPVDRLVSKFYYLQKATWEGQYRPQWKRIDVLEFARNRNTDNNHMVKKLAGLGPNDSPKEADLRIAMRTIKKRFIVGLMDQMEESVHRFNIVMGINESAEENQECMNHFFHNSIGAKKHNSNSHPKVDPGSATWNALAKKNALDIRLYEFVLQLFDEQRETIDSYASGIAGWNGLA